MRGMTVGCRHLALGLVSAVILAAAIFTFQSPVLAQAGASKELAIIPPNKDTDLKFYRADGKIQMGVAALEHMTSDADLVLWVAGNQFFAMAYRASSGLDTFSDPGRRLGLQWQGISRRARHLCLCQSRASAAAQGGRPHEPIRDLHAQRVADHGREGQ